jgi:putative chitinase
MTAPRFARRLGWRTLKKAGTFPGDKRPAAFWRQLAKDLAYAMAAHNIWKPITCAHFVAQIAHESANFVATEEFASGSAYEGRGDLGNTHPGDGVRYKGRTYMQITGRANYRALPHWDGIDFEKHPDRLGERKYAALGAAYWWMTHDLNKIATSGSDLTVERVTRRINGGINGLDDRRRRFKAIYPNRKSLTPSRRPPT